MSEEKGWGDDGYPRGWPTFPIEPGYPSPPPGVVEYTESVYYWWWMFMRLVPDYGPNHPLYEDFGDLGREDEFRHWWWDTNLIFAEMVSEGRISDETIGELVDLKLALGNNFRVFYNPETTDAKYPVYTKPDIKALKATWWVYKLKQDNPTMSNYEVFLKGYEMGVFKFCVGQLPEPKDSPATATNKKSVVTATISRYLKHAKAYIENVGKGVFPKKD